MTSVTALPRRPALGFGMGHALTALVITVGVFEGLPARWMPVDLPAAVLIALHTASAVLLFRLHARARDVARVAALASLVVGLLLIAILAWTAAYLSGVYGPVGRGGAIIMALVAALAVPYLVALPAGELLWLGPSPARPQSAPTAKPVSKPPAKADAPETKADAARKDEEAGAPSGEEREGGG